MLNMLASNSALLDILVKIGIALGALLVVLSTVFWLVQPFSKKKNSPPKIKQIAEKQSDLQYAQNLVGFEKRDDNKEITVENKENEKVRFSEEKALEEQKNIEAEKAKTAAASDVIFSDFGKDVNKANDNKNFFTEPDDTYGKAFDFSKAEAKPRNDFSAFGVEDNDAKQDAFAAFESSKNEETGDAFSAFGKEIKDEDAFPSFGENAENKSAIITPPPSVSSMDKGNADAENNERFERILDLLNKNASEDKNANPAIERDLIENITREKLNEMLEARENEHSVELEKMQREVDEIKEQLRIAKAMKSDEYNQLLAAKDAKEAEIERQADNLAELKRELEREKAQAQLEHEREQMKAEFAQQREEYQKEKACVRGGYALQAADDADEITTMRREIEAAKREMALQREELARERAEMQQRAKKAEFDREMEKHLAEINAIKRDLERERQQLVYSGGRGGFAPQESRYDAYSAYNPEDSALRRDLERQRRELEREKIAMEDRARRADFEREMEKRLEEIERIKADAERERKRAFEEAEREKKAVIENAEREKRKALAEAEQEFKRAEAEHKKYTGDNGSKGVEIADKLKLEKMKISEQLEAQRAELEKQREEIQEQLAFERAEAIEKMKQQFAQYQQEIDNQLKRKAETEIVKEGWIPAAEAKSDIESAQMSELTRIMSELVEERRAAREEAASLRAELEAERIDSQNKLAEQFEALKEELARQKQAELEVQTEIAKRRDENESAVLAAKHELAREYQDLVDELRREHEANEQALREKYSALQKQMEQQTEEALKQSEDAERQLKEQFDEYKASISSEAEELAKKNEELLRELEQSKEEADKVLETERARLQEQVRSEYEENERQLQEKYMQLRAELQRESRQLEEKRNEIGHEMAELKRAQESLGELNTGAQEQWDSERAKLHEQADAMRDEMERLKHTQLDSRDLNRDERAAIEEELLQMRLQLQREQEAKDADLKAKYDALVMELRREEEAINKRQQELLEREESLAQEENRIRNESAQVTDLIKGKNYTVEERDRILADYRTKLDVLRERLRVNEKAIRENNREFVPLRRIKDTLERDLKQLRKREAVVAKQQVLVYGVNNITELDPERIKKLEHDIQQLSGLQQSVANCEDILAKNKDRYPTLENLNKVLQSQNKQLLSDIEEIQMAMEFFETSVGVKE